MSCVVPTNLSRSSLSRPIKLGDRQSPWRDVDAQIAIFVFQPAHRFRLVRYRAAGTESACSQPSVALWRAVARYSVLRRVMACIVAERRDGFDLAQLFGVVLDRFAVDEKLIAARAFDAHTIQMALLAKSLY